MTTFFYSLVALLVITTPILFIIWLVRMAMKKKALKIGVATAICAGSIIPLAIIGALVNPATYCKHEYTVVEEIPATCKEKGQITRVCSLCNDKKTEKIEKTEHSWQVDSTVPASCTEKGYIVQVCQICKDVRHTETTDALGHSMKEVSRTEPTRESTGKVVYRCERCGSEESKTLDKLPPITYVEGVTFDEIYRAYKDNELRANEKYQNKRYRVTAKVYSISAGSLLGFGGGATLALETTVDGTYVIMIAVFGKDQEAALKEINTGDMITFEGKCLSSLSWDNCEIVK